ncbi:MAG: hypothetical protein KC478_06295 [Bacteriovoracaceae bacterium]|nr:hypothetical protein [Bacteriovoracaceae bacterium]
MKAISIIFIISSLSFAQTVDLDAPRVLNDKELLLTELEELESKEDIDFEQTLETMNEKINRYALVRKKECMGEYSSMEITPEGESRILKNKLSKEEKKLCLLELIRLRKSFANSLFKVRKNYIKKQHKEQLRNLEALRSETIQELETMGKVLK